MTTRNTTNIGKQSVSTRILSAASPRKNKVKRAYEAGGKTLVNLHMKSRAKYIDSINL